MIYATIFASALALGAVALAALAWSTSFRVRLELDSSRSTTQSSLRTLAAKLVRLEELASAMNKTAPAGLAAQVAELSDAVARLAKTQQRFAGKYYASGKREPAEQRELNGIDDPELAAELALQTAPPVRPGS